MIFWLFIPCLSITPIVLKCGLHNHQGTWLYNANLVQKLRPGMETSVFNKGLTCKWTTAPTLRSHFYSTASSLLKLLTGAGCLPAPPGTPSLPGSLCHGVHMAKTGAGTVGQGRRDRAGGGGWPDVSEFSSQRFC